jgi:hypothetical protein
MQIDDQLRIAAPQAAVWAALNDPAVLEACIPGCEKIVAAAPTEMSAAMVIKVGPIKARFTGRVTLTEIDAPNGYKIVGEGQGGVAGFAKGHALVRLTQDGDETVLTYSVEANVGGKIAQLGSRMIEGAARKLAQEFFTALRRHLVPEPVVEEVKTEKRGWFGGVTGGA